MWAVDIREQVVVGTSVSAVVVMVMVMAFVTAAFVVVMIIRHMCECGASGCATFAAVIVTITRTGFNETVVNNH